MCRIFIARCAQRYNAQYSQQQQKSPEWTCISDKTERPEKIRQHCCFTLELSDGSWASKIQRSYSPIMVDHASLASLARINHATASRMILKTIRAGIGFARQASRHEYRDASCLHVCWAVSRLVLMLSSDSFPGFDLQCLLLALSDKPFVEAWASSVIKRISFVKCTNSDSYVNSKLSIVEIFVILSIVVTVCW